MDEAHVINPETNLIGVSSSPEITPRQNDVGVLMFNAGYLHHVGPNRLHTMLARLLAESGFHSLRLDFSGLGDSGANANVQNNTELVLQDARAAMDFMQLEFHCQKFILFGICSGALDSLHVALDDERIAGVVAIDSLGFRTRRFYYHHLVSHIAPRMFNAKHILRGLNSLRTLMAQRNRTVRSIADDGNLANMSRNEVQQILKQLTARKTKLRFIYTGGVVNFYNYTTQFQDMFPQCQLDTHLSSRYFPQADHLFMLLNHRDRLLNDVQQWICSEFTHSENVCI